MPARRSKTNQRCELRGLATGNARMVAVHDDECASALADGARARERERQLTLLAHSDFANTSGEQPAEGRAARDDEGLTTHERITGEPTAEGRTARHDDSCLDRSDERRLADNATPSNVTGQLTRTTSNDFGKTALRSMRTAKLVLRGSNV